jgi:hypothetical protein
VSFVGGFRLVLPYIQDLRSSGLLCGVGRKLVADFSGLSTDHIVRGQMTAWCLKKGPIYCLENSVTGCQNSTRDILKETGFFNF